MDRVNDFYKERISALVRAMYTTKYIRDDNIPCKIEEGLYLGSLGAANNKTALKSLNVTHILTVANSLPPAHPNEFTYKIIDTMVLLPSIVSHYTTYIAWSNELQGYLFPDREDIDIAQHFDECFSFIDEAKTISGGVLVHCFVGKSRSVTVVVAYLMKKQGMSMSEALEHVRSKRPIASPNSGFIRQLQNFERSLRGTKI